jgi:hypothetical protein
MPNGLNRPNMRHALVALLVFVSPLSSGAQKHYLYTDAGLSFDYGGNPGFSATYNYNLGKHIGVGAGVQGYMWYPAITNPRQFTPAAFLDCRFLIRPKRPNQYFILSDLGMDFYKHKDDNVRKGNYVYSVPKDNGIYFGLGMGYFRRLGARGWGPYATLKLITNFHPQDELHLSTGAQKSYTIGDGTFVLSVGFRFGG